MATEGSQATQVPPNESSNMVLLANEGKGTSELCQ